MVNINEILITDLCKFNNIVQEYLPGTGEDVLYEMYNNDNNIFAGYYLDNELIGVCFGNSIDKERYVLNGLAIACPHNKKGKGSELLRFFENVVKSKGYKSISLGSADGYVEKFYIKNGYMLSSLKILTDNEEWGKRNNDLYPISKVETQGKYTKLVIENINYEAKDKQKICEFYDGCECFYVFEKNI